MTTVLNTLGVVLVAASALGWVLFQAFAELRYHLEFRNLDQHLPLGLVGCELTAAPALPPLRPGAFVVDAEVVEP